MPLQKKEEGGRGRGGEALQLLQYSTTKAGIQGINLLMRVILPPLNKNLKYPIREFIHFFPTEMSK